VWTVGLLEGANFIVGQVDVERCHRIGKVMLFGRSHDRSGDDRILQYPSQGDVRHRDATGLGDLVYRLDDRPVAVDVEASPDWIDVETLRVFPPRPRQPSLRKRRVRDAPDSLIGQQAEHLALLLPLHEVVLILHGDEPGPPMQIS
jgi:hypothetical protein